VGGGQDKEFVVEQVGQLFGGGDLSDGGVALFSAAADALWRYRGSNATSSSTAA